MCDFETPKPRSSNIDYENLDNLYKEYLNALKPLILNINNVNHIDLCFKWLNNLNNCSDEDKMHRNCLIALLYQQLKTDNNIELPFTNPEYLKLKLSEILNNSDILSGSSSKPNIQFDEESLQNQCNGSEPDQSNEILRKVDSLLKSKSSFSMDDECKINNVIDNNFKNNSNICIYDGCNKIKNIVCNCNCHLNNNNNINPNINYNNKFKIDNNNNNATNNNNNNNINNTIENNIDATKDPPQNSKLEDIYIQKIALCATCKTDSFNRNRAKNMHECEAYDCNGSEPSESNIQLEDKPKITPDDSSEREYNVDKTKSSDVLIDLTNLIYSIEGFLTDLILIAESDNIIEDLINNNVHLFSRIFSSNCNLLENNNNHKNSLTQIIKYDNKMQNIIKGIALNIQNTINLKNIDKDNNNFINGTWHIDSNNINNNCNIKILTDDSSLFKTLDKDTQIKYLRYGLRYLDKSRTKLKRYYENKLEAQSLKFSIYQKTNKIMKLISMANDVFLESNEKQNDYLAIITNIEQKYKQIIIDLIEKIK